MSQTERIHQIVHLLESSRHPVPLRRFLDELEVSRATFKRDLGYLRDRLGAPIAWRRGDDGRPGGYVIDASPDARGRDFGIRGLWFNQSEIHALLTMHQLASRMQPGLLAEQSQALLTRITHMLGSADDDPEAVLSYIQIVHSATHRRPSAWFEVIARATVRRHRLAIRYFTRSRNRRGERTVSPQRLLHYRENWYLLAWCHTARDLRLFALDAIEDASRLCQTARRVSDARLQRAIGDGFGIFGGRAVRRARLRFTPEAARWIRDETWHPRQRQHWDGERLILEVPYAQSRELIMEILRHGSDVEVLAPAELRREVMQCLRAALAGYG
ncbi:MAG: WYL domain-containing protein [Gammaproteobacteria bacterium]|nr:WYL domain-containing protein [Gammaproteobacteria bacterium]